LKTTESGNWAEIQQNTKQGAESTEIGSWAKCDEQIPSGVQWTQKASSQNLGLWLLYWRHDKNMINSDWILLQ